MIMSRHGCEKGVALMIVDSTNTGSGARSTRLALESAATEQAKSQGALCLEKGEWPANERCWSMANLSLDWAARSSGNLEERGRCRGTEMGWTWERHGSRSAQPQSPMDEASAGTLTAVTCHQLLQVATSR